MKNLYRYSLSAIILLSLANPYVFAQDQKSEVETSIGETEMPVPALNILKQFWNEKKKQIFTANLMATQ
ncbi:hypothetical protein [Gracilimonas halophila]|uniref:Uncharacterized protein n=1 Tax=Gracilimonas halophila TaxID=1834464 RepID=A0ABW5JJY7_9BACT